MTDNEHKDSPSRWDVPTALLGRHGWAYLALVVPGLHLVLCAIVALEGPNIGLDAVARIDYPFSLLILLIAGWNSRWLLGWFALFGTIWWYLVVRVLEIEVAKAVRWLRGRRERRARKEL